MANSVLSVENCKIFGRAFLKVKLARGSGDSVSIPNTPGAREAFEQAHGISLGIARAESDHHQRAVISEEQRPAQISAPAPTACNSQQSPIRQQPAQRPVLAPIAGNSQSPTRQQHFQKNTQTSKPPARTKNNGKRARDAFEAQEQTPTSCKYFRAHDGRRSAHVVQRSPQVPTATPSHIPIAKGNTSEYKALGISSINQTTTRLLPSQIILKAPGSGQRQGPAPNTLFWKGKTVAIKSETTLISAGRCESLQVQRMMEDNSAGATPQVAAGRRPKRPSSDSLRKQALATAGQKRKPISMDQEDAQRLSPRQRARLNDQDLATTTTQKNQESRVPGHDGIGIDQLTSDTFAKAFDLNGINTQQVEETVVTTAAVPTIAGRKRKLAESVAEEADESNQKRARMCHQSTHPSQVSKPSEEPTDNVINTAIDPALDASCAPALQEWEASPGQVEKTFGPTEHSAFQATGERVFAESTHQCAPFFAVEDVGSFPYPTYQAFAASSTAQQQPTNQIFAASSTAQQQESGVSKGNEVVVGRYDSSINMFTPEQILDSFSGGVDMLAMFSLAKIRATFTDEQLEEKYILWAVRDDQIDQVDLIKRIHNMDRFKEASQVDEAEVNEIAEAFASTGDDCFLSLSDVCPEP